MTTTTPAFERLSGWSVRPARAGATIESGAEASLPFTLELPADAPPGRHVITADITLGDRRWGQLAEAWVDVIAQEVT